MLGKLSSVIFFLEIEQRSKVLPRIKKRFIVRRDYLQSFIFSQIQSTLAESDDYVMDSPKDHTVCVGGGQKKMVSWQITLQSLGNYKTL